MSGQPYRQAAPDAMFEVREVLERPPLTAARTAVVVIDMVKHQLTPDRWLLAHLRRRGVDTAYLRERIATLVVPAHQRLLRAARETGARVVYLRVGTNAVDYADGGTHFREFFPIWEAREGSESLEVLDEIAPAGNDLVVTKLGSGGFTSSALDHHLRNLGVTHVAYTGVITNACVLLTAAAGFDLGYHGYLVTDATATFSPRLQDATEEILGASMAQLVSADDMARLLVEGALSRA